MTELECERNKSARLEAVVKAQNDGLGHWRRQSDQDAGKIARLENCLFRIAHSQDDLPMVRELARQQLSVMPSPPIPFTPSPLGPPNREGLLPSLCDALETALRLLEADGSRHNVWHELLKTARGL